MRRVLLIAAGVVVVIGAGLLLRSDQPDGGSVTPEPVPSEAGEYANVRDLIAAIRSEGIECKKVLVSAPNPTEDIVDFGSCQMDDRAVNLHIYTNDAALQEHINNQLAAQGKNPNYFTSLVAGDLWVVDTYSDKTSSRIQEAIGGEIH